MHFLENPPDFNLPDHPETLPLFVYGSLRPLGSDYHRIENLVTAQPSPGKISGTLHYSSDKSYPVLRKGTGIVTGDILVVKTGSELWDVLCCFELAWGYTLAWVDVLYLEHDRDSASTPIGGKVLACVWDWDTGFSGRIISGDWFSQ